MSTSIHQRRANRLNSLKSTGPQSEVGKRRSRYNAITHGIFAKCQVLPGEDEQEFAALNRSLLLGLNPRDALELQMAQHVIAASWKSRRATEAEANMYQAKNNEFDEQEREETEKEIGELEDNLQTLDRRLRQTKHFKQELQEEHRSAQAALQQAQKKLDELQMPMLSGGLLATMFAANDPALERIHRYQQRIDNSMYRALRELKELQKREITEPSELTLSLLDEETQNEANSPDIDDKDSSAQELASEPAHFKSREQKQGTSENAHGSAVGLPDDPTGG